MEKDILWKLARLGLITASELSDIKSAKGGIIDTNLSYIRKKRFERKHKFALPIHGKALDVGNEQEPYAVEWFRANHPEIEIVYSKDLDYIPFWSVDWAKFGASPDCFTPDHKIVVELKTVYSNGNVEFFSDEYTSYEEKKAVVLKEHGAQLEGQFLSNDKVEEIWVLKYIYQRDDIMEDQDSPTAEWRGLIFKFKREDFNLDIAKDDIIMFDKLIDSKINPSEIKKSVKRDESGRIICSLPLS